MTRRAILLMGVAAMLTLTAGGVLAAWANARTTTKAVDCCLDPTCPPGCSEVCPPDCCPVSTAATTKTTAKTSCCCDDPSCPPGCTLECAAECLPVATQSAKGKTYCPPCPFCP